MIRSAERGNDERRILALACVFQPRPCFAVYHIGGSPVYEIGGFVFTTHPGDSDSKSLHFTAAARADAISAAGRRWRPTAARPGLSIGIFEGNCLCQAFSQFRKPNFR